MNVKVSISIFKYYHFSLVFQPQSNHQTIYIHFIITPNKNSPTLSLHVQPKNLIKAFKAHNNFSRCSRKQQIRTLNFIKDHYYFDKMLSTRKSMISGLDT